MEQADIQAIKDTITKAEQMLIDGVWTFDSYITCPLCQVTLKEHKKNDFDNTCIRCHLCPLKDFFGFHGDQPCSEYIPKGGGHFTTFHSMCILVLDTKGLLNREIVEIKKMWVMAMVKDVKEYMRDFVLK